MRLKKRHSYLLVGLGLIIMMICGWGGFYYSKAQTWARTIAALRADNEMQYFKSSDAQLKITPATLRPLSNYFKTSQQSGAAFLKANAHYLQFKVTGKHWLIFNKYQLVIKPVTLHITTNHAATQLLINHHHYGNVNYHKNVGPLVPGKYCLQTNYQQHSNHTTLIVNQSMPVDMAVKQLNLQINGYPGARIYLNHRYQATINKHGYYYLHCPWSSQLLLQQIYPGKGGQVTSQVINISKMSNKIPVTVTYPLLLNKVMANNWLDLLVSALNENQQLLSCFFVNGKKNASYQLLLKNNNYLANQHVESVNYQVKLQQVLPLKPGMTQLVFDINSTVNNDDNSVNQYQYEYVTAVKGISHSHPSDLLQNYQITKIERITLLKKSCS